LVPSILPDSSSLAQSFRLRMGVVLPSPARSIRSGCLVMDGLPAHDVTRLRPSRYAIRVRRVPHILHPPATAATIQNGSAPDPTASGSGVSGESWEMSSWQAK